MHIEDNHGTYDESALRRHASGLWRNLCSVFPDGHPALIHIEALFNWCFSNGGREFTWVVRAEDDSFNPRCARIPQILITEIKEQSLDALMLAVAISIPHTTIPATIDGSEMYLGELAALHSLYSGQPAITQHTNVVFAAMIDTVRHLHNSRLKYSDRLQLLGLAQKLYSMEHPIPAHPRLRVMLQHAITQQERRCNGS